MHVNVAIVGLNRLSVSFALALKQYAAQPKAQHTFSITGSDAQNHLMKAAEEIGALDNSHRSITRAINGANLVIVNAPPSEIEHVYTRLGAELKAGMVVLDFTPYKTQVLELARQHFPVNAKGTPIAYLVGVTPIVNIKGLYSGEVSIESAQADLFEDAEFLVTPNTQCPAEAITLAEDIIRLAGGTGRFMDPAEHDGLTTATEVLPSLVGAGLFFMLNQSDGWMELRRMINPATGSIIQNLRYQNAADLLALFTQHQSNLLRHLDAYIGTLNQIRAALIDEAGPEQIEVLLTRLYSEWEKWDAKRYTNNWAETQAPDLGSGNLMSNLFGGNLLRGKPDRDDE